MSVEIYRLTNSRKDGKEPSSIDPPEPWDHERMMNSPEYWPNWPLLPLVNWKMKDEDGSPRAASLYDREGDQGGDGARFKFCIDVTRFQYTEEDLRNGVDADITQLLDDGWMVD